MLWLKSVNKIFSDLLLVSISEGQFPAACCVDVIRRASGAKTEDTPPLAAGQFIVIEKIKCIFAYCFSHLSNFNDVELHVVQYLLQRKRLNKYVGRESIADDLTKKYLLTDGEARAVVKKFALL